MSWKASQFNVLLTRGTTTGIYNSFTGRFLTLPRKWWDAVRVSQGEQLSDVGRRCLADAGILVPRARDEQRHFLDAVRRREQSERWADVMFVSCPAPLPESAEKAALKRMGSYIAELARRQAVDVVKLRMLGWGQRPLEQRLRLLAALQSMRRMVTLPVFVMWVSDDLSDAARLDAASADAFSFLFDPTRLVATADSLSQLRRQVGRLARRGRGVYLGLVTDAAFAVEQHLAKLRWAAGAGRRRTGPAVLQCGLHLRAAGKGLYCRLDCCGGPQGLLNKPRWRIACSLRAAGIPVNLAVHPLSVHSNCPYTHPAARIYDWEGNVFHCLEDVDRPAACRVDAPAAHAPRSAPVAGSAGAVILADPQCRCCSMLPVCSNGCPRQGRSGACPDYHDLLSRWFLGGGTSTHEDV